MREGGGGGGEGGGRRRGEEGRMGRGVREGYPLTISLTYLPLRSLTSSML